MFRKRNVVVLLLVLAAVCPVFAADGCLEVWQARYLFNKISAQVHRDGNAISGIVTIQPLSGDTLTYHFSGTMRNGVIQASHRDGHVFRGHLVSQGVIEGTLTTKNGTPITLQIQKRSGEPGKLRETQTDRRDYANRKTPDF